MKHSIDQWLYFKSQNVLRRTFQKNLIQDVKGNTSLCKNEKFIKFVFQFTSLKKTINKYVNKYVNITKTKTTGNV